MIHPPGPSTPAYASAVPVAATLSRNHTRRMAKGVLPPRFDPGSPEAQSDPYAVYARLREQDAVCRIGPGTYGVTRHEDVSRLLRDPQLGSEFPMQYHEMSSGVGAASSFFSRIVLYRDPPVHTRLRRLLGAAFTPASVRQLRPRIEALVADLLREPLTSGRFDAVATVCYPLPVLVVCELMGIPPEHRAEVRHYAADLGKAFAALVPQGDRAAANAAVDWLRSFVATVIEDRRLRPSTSDTPDVLTRLMTAEIDGERLSHDEVVDNAVFAFFAGFETTMNLLSAAFAYLGDNPQAQAELRADPMLLPTAVEELLRIEPPIQGAARLLHADVPVGRYTLRAGRVAVLLIGSANRDPAVFEAPDELRLDRTPNPHVSFGGGAHLCMGAALARAEADVLLTFLLENTRHLELTGPPDRRIRGIRAFDAIPVATS